MKKRNKYLLFAVTALLLLMLLAACTADIVAPPPAGGEIQTPGFPDSGGNEQNGSGEEGGEEVVPPESQEPSEPGDGYEPPYEGNVTPSKTLKLQATADVNFRSGAGTEYAVLGTLKRWQFAPYIEKAGNWYKTIFEGILAYISTTYAKTVPIDAVAEPIERIIGIGMELMGTPYVYGAPRKLTWDLKVNPDFTGESFDCSSFVQYVFYTGAGVKLLGDSRSMSTQNAPSVSYNNLRRGDVIFMTTPGRWDKTGVERIGHVAIYLGDNQLLHTYGAPGVAVTAFYGKWSERYISAKRFL